MQQQVSKESAVVKLWGSLRFPCTIMLTWVTSGASHGGSVLAGCVLEGGLTLSAGTGVGMAGGRYGVRCELPVPPVLAGSP